MSFSVVVPSYNQAAFLGAALDSLVAQNAPDLEIIVIDGGSVDGTREVVAGYAEAIAYWESERDNGQSHALNKGFARATGQWLGWLNSDDLLLPGAIDTLRRAISERPSVRWVAGGGWFIDAGGKRKTPYPAPRQPLGARDLAPWTYNWFAQPGCFFRRDLFEAAGALLREDLHYAMDLDLWLRMGVHDRLEPVQAELGAYRLHGDSKTVAERPEMETEVVRVLFENLGMEAALARVQVLASDKFLLEHRYRRLTADLVSPRGWLRLLKRRMTKSGECIAR